ncbi:TonB-dependent receptor [Sediminibacterium sp. TEGAF015]|uniref:hypothetical protein n=1 Tax=Sediminibacterium sp. TEGAF015 TaxID=575378 RepID=UPI0021FD3743|nr:hypothetical protein [Sediminibacterium sp. TEGAF015]BDQ11302.1 hypothetical protein TEGAF0_05190 [Sediminibacterium sp. TEGAF015]
MKPSSLFLFVLLLIGFTSDVAAQRKKKSVKSKKTAIRKTTKAKKKNKAVASRKNNNNQKTTQVQNVKGESISVAYSIPNSQDSSSPKTVIITSAFKPSLQNAAKVNFTAATGINDSSRLPLTYKVPSSNLFFLYQPIPLKPLALPSDSPMVWKNTHQVKLGAGNLSSFMGEGKFSFGDIRNAVTQIEAGYIRTQGKLYAQQYSKFHLDVLNHFTSKSNLEWTSRANFHSTTRYKYGFLPSSLAYTKDQIQLVYNALQLEVGLKNSIPTASKINFNPVIQFNRFTNAENAGENNLILNAPIQKELTSQFSLQMAFQADIANYKTDVNAWKNNLIILAPSVKFRSNAFNLEAGIRPSWDNSAFHLLPNLILQTGLSGTSLKLEAGFQGSIDKNSFRSLAKFNPWIALPNAIKNTRMIEQFIGFKGNSGNHISYNAKLAYRQLTDQPLFINQLGDGKSFDLLYTNMNMLHLVGEMNYAVQEKLTLTAGAQYNHFSKISAAPDAFGMIPLELTGTVLWKPLSDLQIKSDIFYRSGSMYRDQFSLASKRLSPAVDLNIGVEFGLLPKLNAWIQMNNIFNNVYQRWNQYPVFGFNVLGGVVYSFQ